MIRAYRFEDYHGKHNLWETDPVHIAALHACVRLWTKSSREWEHEFPSDKGPTPLGAEWAYAYAIGFRMTQRFFLSQAAVDTANAWEHRWRCMDEARQYVWWRRTPAYWCHKGQCPRRLLVTMAALQRDICFHLGRDVSPDTHVYFRPEDWQVRLFAQRGDPFMWS